MALSLPSNSPAMARSSKAQNSRTGPLLTAGLLTTTLWLGLGATSPPGALAENCTAPNAERPAMETGSEQSPQPYASPVDLSSMTQAQQQQLETTVAERKLRLPYQSLSLYRCPNLSNSAFQALETEDYALALLLLDRAIAQRPDSLTHWLDRAVVHYYLGENAAARSDATQVHHRLVDLNFPDAQNAYDQLVTQLDGYAPDARRAKKL